MPFHIGPWEIGLILAIILIVFGVGKLPQVGGAIGKGLREFRKGQNDESYEGEEAPKLKGMTTKKTAKDRTAQNLKSGKQIPDSYT